VIIYLKNQTQVSGFNFDVCRIEDCYGPSEVLWSSKEGPTVDVCMEHKSRLVREENPIVRIKQEKSI